LRDLSQSIAAHIEPKIFPHITFESLQGKTCIKVAFKGSDAPYFARGKAYIRVADEDRQLSANELKQLILDKHRDVLGWDSELHSSGHETIDPDKLKDFVKTAGLAWNRPVDVLEKLGVMKNGQLLNAATPWWPNSCVVSTWWRPGARGTAYPGKGAGSGIQGGCQTVHHQLLSSLFRGN
jgi:ATP-dependent DNA helicase RecG